MSSRAAWWAGMLRAEKLSQSLSMSGPSAISKPMAPKMAAISSMVRLIGWIRPAGAGRGGRVTSRRSAARRASSAAASSAARRASMAAASSSFSAFSAAPRVRRSSGGGAAEFLQQGGEAAVLAEHADAHRVPGAQVGGGGEGRVGFGLQRQQIVAHCPVPCKKGRPARAALCVIDRRGPLRARSGPWPYAVAGAGERAACTFLTISPNEAGSS